MFARALLLGQALAICLIVIIVFVMALKFEDETTPQYQGKPLCSWLTSFEEEYATYGSSTNFDNAVRQLGTNAIPTLLRMLRENSPITDEIRVLLRKKHLIKAGHVRAYLRNDLAAHGFEVLGPQAKQSVPSLIKILERNVSLDSQAATAAALGNIGPPAEQAIPSLLKVLSGRAGFAKCQACRALAKIQRNPDRVVPVLVGSAVDPDRNVRVAAVTALGEFGTAAKAAIPRLIEAFNDSDTAVRHAAGKALMRIDWATAEKIGVTTNVWFR